MTEPPEQPVARLLDAPSIPRNSSAYTPPRRAESPFQPPPLTPLELRYTCNADSLLLTRSLAEEIRLLFPPRLQLVTTWRLAYSMEIHGSSLSSLYQACENISLQAQRAGWVVVIRDNSMSGANGSVFGAYLSDPPNPSPHYYGTGECFLWRASILPSLRNLQVSTNGNHISLSEKELMLAGLPPPPSADTTNVERSTTVRSDRRPSKPTSPSGELLAPPLDSLHSGASTPDRIRFKAFPYSGINDFMIFCESHYLSVGGGDGHYGLWLDDSLDNGISETCPTFGNEPLSDEGGKFDVLGVEVWYAGA